LHDLLRNSQGLAMSFHCQPFFVLILRLNDPVLLQFEAFSRLLQSLSSAADRLQADFFTAFGQSIQFAINADKCRGIQRTWIGTDQPIHATSAGEVLPFWDQFAPDQSWKRSS